MKILAIDYGEARVGIAVCDETETFCFPLKTIKNLNQKDLIENIKQLVNLKKAKMIVLGLPLNMNSSEGEKAKICKEFAKKLKISLNLPVALYDERQTTKQALNYLNLANIKKKKKKNVIDSVAATIILEDFLKYKNNNLKINLI